MTITDVPSVSSLPLGLVELRLKRRESVLAQLIAAAERAGIVRDADILLASLLLAQRVGRNAVGKGLAVPHARSFAVNRPGLLLGRSIRGIEWGSLDGLGVQLVALVLSPAAMPVVMHADRVAAALHALRLQRTRQRLLDVDPADADALLRGVWA